MKKLNLKDIKNTMSRNEMREVKGGLRQNPDSPETGVTWKCCWVGTNNCSQCAGHGVCASGADLRKCGPY